MGQRPLRHLSLRRGDSSTDRCLELCRGRGYTEECEGVAMLKSWCPVIYEIVIVVSARVARIFRLFDHNHTWLLHVFVPTISA